MSPQPRCRHEAGCLSGLRSQYGKESRHRANAAEPKEKENAGRSRRAAHKRRSASVSSPDVIPMILYEDGMAALDWLGRAFGFEETARQAGPDGQLAHGEMKAGSGVIMLATPTPDYQGPKRTEKPAIWRDDGRGCPGLSMAFSLSSTMRSTFRARRSGAVILSEVRGTAWQTLSGRGSRGAPLVLHRALTTFDVEWR